MTKENDLFKKEMASMMVKPMEDTPMGNHKAGGGPGRDKTVDRVGSAVGADTETDLDQNLSLFMEALDELGSPPQKNPSPRPEPARVSKKTSFVKNADPTVLSEEFKSEERTLFLSQWANFGEAPDKDVPPEPPRGIRKIRISNNVIIHPHDILDLHGKTVAEAQELVAVFIASCSSEGVSKVKIITGKGRRSRDGISALKPMVEHWIWHMGDPYIHSFGEAPRAQGGSGALICFLRRN